MAKVGDGPNELAPGAPPAELVARDQVVVSVEGDEVVGKWGGAEEGGPGGFDNNNGGGGGGRYVNNNNDVGRGGFCASEGPFGGGGADVADRGGDAGGGEDSGGSCVRPHHKRSVDCCGDWSPRC